MKRIAFEYEIKRRIKQLICCLIVSIVSISFNSEARLPKYMAQRAAELLIEKSKLRFIVETPENHADKVTAYATRLVNFLYNTKNRQSLANWMKRRLPFKVHGNRVNVLPNERAFIDIFDGIDKAYNDDVTFRSFVNQLFPCWTGTLTCFMLNTNNTANIALPSDSIVQKCQELLGNTNNTYKVISVLFTLELVDNWMNLKSICINYGEGDDSERLSEPLMSDDFDDPYDYVPVPNTMYEVEEEYKGTCLISTVRNLLCIFCKRDHNLVFPACVKDEVHTYFDSFDSFAKLTIISGITNIDGQHA